MQDDTFLEVYYVKGLPLYWEPFTKEWFVIFPYKCQYLSTQGCLIYENRPTGCRMGMCPWPGWIQERIKILLRASEKILKHKFGEVLYGGDRS